MHNNNGICRFDWINFGVRVAKISPGNFDRELEFPIKNGNEIGAKIGFERG